jgi:hypothetical protein
MAQRCCPICGKVFDEQASAAMPFCSDRCRQIDLRRWLTESYALPVVRPREEDEPQQQPSADDAE